VKIAISVIPQAAPAASWVAMSPASDGATAKPCESDHADQAGHGHHGIPPKRLHRNVAGQSARFKPIQNTA
jgi:hypothetical protein